MEKVKVSKEVFDKLQDLKKYDKSIQKGDIDLYIRKYQSAESGWNEHYLILSKLTLDEFLRCIYVGYELEKTKEEILLEVYDNHDNHHAYGKGIKKCLNVLGIKIKGINE